VPLVELAAAGARTATRRVARRWSWLGAAGVSILAFTAGASSAGAAAVQVVRCPTSYGITQPNRALPSVLSTKLSAAQAHGLAFYGNNDLLLLAPEGWRCTGEVGADGSTSMHITHGHEAITELAVVSGGYAGAFEACSLFPGARPPTPCSTHPPEAESDVRLSSTAVAFEDPPGIHGTGDPSGGSLPANGLMIYDPSYTRGFFFEETCTLPPIEHGVCSVLLNDSLTRAPK
jgi:hypothetical protein